MKIGRTRINIPLLTPKNQQRRVFPGQLVYVLKKHNIDCFLDVGANIGQTGREIRHWGYEGEIYSVEPVQAAYDQLLRKAAKDPNWHVMDRMALGDAEGTIDINVSESTDMSSALSVTKYMQRVYERSKVVGTESVPLHRADSLFAEHIKGKRAILKIDVQGYDFQVLQGASGIMDSLQGVMIELSLQPLYETEPSYLEVLQFLHDSGMKPQLIVQRAFKKKISQQLQIDAVFIRE